MRKCKHLLVTPNLRIISEKSAKKISNGVHGNERNSEI